jgi:hypothetical protein
MKSLIFIRHTSYLIIGLCAASALQMRSAYPGLKAHGTAMNSKLARRASLHKDVVQRSAGLTKPESAEAARFCRSPHA